MRSSTAVLASL